MLLLDHIFNSNKCTYAVPWFPLVASHLCTFGRISAWKRIFHQLFLLITLLLKSLQLSDPLLNCWGGIHSYFDYYVNYANYDFILNCRYGIYYFQKLIRVLYRFMCFFLNDGLSCLSIFYSLLLIVILVISIHCFLRSSDSSCLR
jgi:hypothetical protein